MTNPDSDSPQVNDTWCPLSRADELWIHQRFDWLTDKLGIKRLWQAPFLTPSERDFPDAFAATEESATVLFARICRYLELDANRLKLGFFSDDDPIE